MTMTHGKSQHQHRRRADKTSWLSEMDCERILSNYLTWSNETEAATSRKLAELLTQEEQEIAACCSNAYWLTSMRSPDKLNDTIRFATAMREARRHLVGIPTFEESGRLLKATVAYHREKKSLLYRTCMMDDFEYDNPEDSKLASERRRRIVENMENQQFIPRGHDRGMNALMLCMPRKFTGNDTQGFVDCCVYSIERSIACTEALSYGKEDAVVTIIDARNSSAPSIKACKAAIGVLQSHYPERLKNLVILDLPYLIQGIYNVVKPFLDPDTKAKFIIVKGEKQKEAA